VLVRGGRYRLVNGIERIEKLCRRLFNAMDGIHNSLTKPRSRPSKPGYLKPWALMAGLSWLIVVGLGGAGFLHVHLGGESSENQVHGHFFLDRHHQHGDSEHSHSHRHPHAHPHSGAQSQGLSESSDLASGKSDRSPADEVPSSDSGPAVSLAPVASVGPAPVTLVVSSPVHHRPALGAEQHFVAPDLLPSRNPRAPPHRSFSRTYS
jgi:hypothetical protein